MLAVNTAPTSNPRGRLKLNQIRELQPLTVDESWGLKFPPHQSMVEFEKKKATARDWETVTFRIMAAHEVIKRNYPSDILADYEQAVSIMKAMKIRAKGGQPFQFRDRQELIHVSDVIRIMDDLQDKHTRETMIHCFRKAQDLMLKL